MEEKEYLSVKEFAEAAGVSTQYIYKILGAQLKPYKKKINKKTYIESCAVEFVVNGFVDDTTNSTLATNQMQPSAEEPLQPLQPTMKPTNSTENATKEKDSSSGEVEALKMLIEELKKDKEQLLQDKDYLKQEALKWQRLLSDEREKVKLLEGAAAPVEDINVVDVEPKEEQKGIFKKIFSAFLKK